jgi:hypothetical protein
MPVEVQQSRSLTLTDLAFWRQVETCLPSLCGTRGFTATGSFMSQSSFTKLLHNTRVCPTSHRLLLPHASGSAVSVAAGSAVGQRPTSCNVKLKLENTWVKFTKRVYATRANFKLARNGAHPVRIAMVETKLSKASVSLSARLQSFSHAWCW